MTTQFNQRVVYTFLLRFAPNNSYFILCPRSVIVNNNKSLTFGGYVSFSDSDSILPHYSPSFPVNFSQFGQAWCEESLRAYFNYLGISSNFNSLTFEGIRYIENGNSLSASGLYSSILLCYLEFNNQIDTDFDNLFSNLISSLNTLLNPISQISLSLLGINNIFPTLVHNLEVLNENNVPVSIAQILKDKQIDVDMSDTQISLDDSNLVTQLQNIYTILASQNANQASISSAIQNKDNQSYIVDKLSNIFEYEIGHFDSIATGSKLSCFKFLSAKNATTSNNVNTSNITMMLNKLIQVFCKQTAGFNLSYSDRVFKDTYLSDISNSTLEMNTKLEQNLPFRTEVNNALIIDGQQEFKIRDKNEDTFD